MAHAGKKCQKCGGESFKATQYVSGTLDVIVSISNVGQVYFDANDTEDGEIDASQLQCESPEGPFTCKKCGTLLDFER